MGQIWKFSFDGILESNILTFKIDLCARRMCILCLCLQNIYVWLNTLRSNYKNWFNLPLCDQFSRSYYFLFSVFYQTIQQDGVFHAMHELCISQWLRYYYFFFKCMHVFASLDDQLLAGKWMTWTKNYIKITNITTTTTITTLAIISIYAKTISHNKNWIDHFDHKKHEIFSMRKPTERPIDRLMDQPNEQAKGKRKQKQNMTKIYTDYNICYNNVFEGGSHLKRGIVYVFTVHCSHRSTEEKFNFMIVSYFSAFYSKCKTSAR